MTLREPLSVSQFAWFCSAITFVVALSWIVVDVVRMRRALRDRAATGSSPEIRDRVFGSIIGLAIGAIGVTGVLLFHLG